jgi:guanosine-3',5'-bis(diphosphate) 3'-pyrophosphohydrolase
VIREMGFRKGEDFYIALGQAKISPKTVTSKLMHRLKEGEAAVEPASAATELLERRETRRRPAARWCTRWSRTASWSRWGTPRS